MLEILQELKEQLIYESDTGNFYWIVPKKGRNHLAGTVSTRGYRVITYNHYKVSCTKLAWYFMTDELPTQPIGFKDGDSLNLKWENLKLTTMREILESYRSTNERLNSKPQVTNNKKVVSRRAKFNRAQLEQAIEEFLKGKVLENDRYQSPETPSQQGTLQQIQG